MKKKKYVTHETFTVSRHSVNLDVFEIQDLFLKYKGWQIICANTDASGFSLILTLKKGEADEAEIKIRKRSKPEIKTLDESIGAYAIYEKIHEKH